VQENSGTLSTYQLGLEFQHLFLQPDHRSPLLLQQPADGAVCQRIACQTRFGLEGCRCCIHTLALQVVKHCCIELGLLRFGERHPAVNSLSTICESVCVRYENHLQYSTNRLVSNV
jgi:hypothetical protein